MPINLDRISNHLANALIGRKVIFLNETISTNVHAAELARQGADEGTVVIADSQTAGKGRLGRVWHSPPGTNHYVSIILRPQTAPDKLSGMTLAAGVAVAETIMRYCPKGVTLKWPNDVQINGKKVCGILAEMQGCGGLPDFMIIGIGININMRRSEFLDVHRDQATSLFEETGNKINRTDFVICLLQNFERYYKIFLAGDFQTIRDRWLSLSAMVGKQVRVIFHDRVENGRVVGMDEKGALLLADERDHIQVIMAGDVSLREGS